MTDKETLGAAIAIVGVVVGAALAFLTQVFWAWWNRTKVKIDFKPVFGAGTSHLCLIEARNGKPTKYIRVSARNKAKWTTACGCRTYLTGIKRCGEDDYIYQDPVPTSVAFIGHEPIDIPPGMTFFFDVFYVMEGDDKIRLCMKSESNALEAILEKASWYEFDMMLAGDNFKQQRRTVVFNWEGSFGSIQVDSFK